VVDLTFARTVNVRAAVWKFISLGEISYQKQSFPETPLRLRPLGRTGGIAHSAALRTNLLNGRTSFLWKSYKKGDELFKLANPISIPTRAWH